MGEDEGFQGVDILRFDPAGTAPGGMGASAAQPHQVGAQAIDGGGEAALGDGVQAGVGQRDVVQALAGLAAALAQGVLFVPPLGEEGLGGVVEGQAPAHNFRALRRLGRTTELHLEAEAVEQLRAQLAFLGVHGADQHEARRVAVRQAIALDVVDAAGGDVEQQVDQMVGQQVDLVDVEHAAVGIG